MDKEKIGLYIKNKRNELGYSQKELANELHVTPQAISKWENGRGLPDIEIIKAMSEIFGVNMEDVLNGEEKEINEVSNEPSKASKAPLYIVIIIFILLALVIFMMIRKPVNTDATFEFMGVSSDNESFEIKGVAAYSSKQKSLYISSIVYNDECKDLYTALEVDILENDEDPYHELASIGNINEETYAKGEHLPEILKQVDIKIDNLETDCKDISASLSMLIKAKRVDGAIITFEVPLDIGGSCEVGE